jgi:hypothetical protein
MLNDEPRRAIPYTEHVLPRRSKLRKLMELPMNTKSKTESDEPSRITP